MSASIRAPKSPLSETLPRVIAHQPPPQDSFEFEAGVAALGKVKRDACNTYVTSASSADVYRVCNEEVKWTLSGRKVTCRACVAVKMPRGLASSQDKRAVLDATEAHVHNNITLALRGTPAEAHFNKMLRVLPDEGKGGEGGVVIVTEYETPATIRGTSFSTVADVVAQCVRDPTFLTDEQWRVMNLHVLGAIAEARRHIPAFQHNDVHNGNVMLVDNSSWHASSFLSAAGQVLAPPTWPFLARIIDFGQVWSTDPKFVTRDGQKVWGFLSPSGMIDFHRWVVWTYFTVAAASTTPTWFPAWKAFVLRWIPTFLLPTGLEFGAVAGPNANPAYGAGVDMQHGGMFNEFGEQVWNELYGNDPVSIAHALDDEYFAAFRASDGQSAAAQEHSPQPSVREQSARARSARSQAATKQQSKSAGSGHAQPAVTQRSSRSSPVRKQAAAKKEHRRPSILRRVQPVRAVKRLLGYDA